MSDDQLRHDVEEELRCEPRIDHLAIAVSADDGEVTLRGTVGSFRGRREAASAAKRVSGVKKIDDKLHVRRLNDDRRDDSDLRGAVLQALMLDSVVPSTIDAARQGRGCHPHRMDALPLPAQRGVRRRQRRRVIGLGDEVELDHRRSHAGRRQARAQ